MADKKGKRTGLGVDALFPPAEEEPVTETPTPQKASPPQTQSKARTRSKAKKAKDVSQKQTRIKATTAEEPEKKHPRRTAWLREDHLERLEALKLRERRRLRQEGKRVSLSTLIDEAMERYLAEMEK